MSTGKTRPWFRLSLSIIALGSLALTAVLGGCARTSVTATTSPVTAASSAPITWRMVSSFGADDYFYTEGTRVFCQRINTLSQGRLVIEPYAAGTLTGALEVFDAVSGGAVECGHSWPGYWRDRDPAFELFSAIPNQMTQEEWRVWLYGPARGIDLWKEFYQPYNLVVFPGGLVGPEFGFFTTRPVTSLADFQGLRLRVSGMAADVARELGATTILTPPDDIKAALSRGEIDGFEYSTPAIDLPMDFQEVAPYVCLPSWHQPSAMFEIEVNQDAWNQLPADLQAIFEVACKEISFIDFSAQLEGANAAALRQLIQKGISVTVLDSAAMNQITEITNRLADAKATQNAYYARVLDSQRQFRDDYRTWQKWGQYSLFPGRATPQPLLDLTAGLHGELSRMDQDLAFASGRLGETGLIGNAARQIMQGLLAGRPYIVDAALVDTRGIMVAVEPEAYAIHEGADISTQPQVIQVQKDRLAVLSSSFYAVEGFEAIDLEYPVFSPQGEFLGSVSLLIKVETLFQYGISRYAPQDDAAFWAMQEDGRILYDLDTAEIGLNLFTDPVYKPYPELVSLGWEIAAAPAGQGRYTFLDEGLMETVKKQASWGTVGLHGTDWRVIMVQVEE